MNSYQQAEMRRIAVAGAYPGDRWRAKVAKMPEDQILAIYLRLKKAGKIK